MKRYRRILLTGAGGALGSALRPHLPGVCDTLRVADRAPLSAQTGQEVIVADMSDRDAVFAMVGGCDAIVHFAGEMKEDWEAILATNVIGIRNLYDAARAAGVTRIVQASSNHATGFYGTDETITPQAAHRPDTLYGLSKCWGEDIARLYFDRYGIESACLRIGSAFPEPKGLRMLATWLSYGDLWRLVRACLMAEFVGFTPIYGVSRNSASFWDNSPVAHIPFEPQDSADDFRSVLEARHPPLDPQGDAAIYQGGPFVRAKAIGS